MPDLAVRRRKYALHSRLHALVFCLAVLPVVSAQRPEKTFEGRQPARRPNILFAIADDWSAPHAGAYGDKAVKTPTFDRVAREGVLFEGAFCVSPSCTPSRASILTGQTIHRLEEGANLWGFLPTKFPVFPDLLEKAGYYIGSAGKGWGPGNLEAAGRARNPAGPTFKSFAEFYRGKPANQPFYFWYGSSDPHRAYDVGSGLRAGMKPDSVTVPPYLPDTPEVRSDILDYLFEVERFDRSVGEMLELLEAAGELDNTIVVITSDNGWPFPRSKANLYDAGTRLPLAVRWPAGGVAGGRRTDALISFTDFAPTFLAAVGLKPLDAITGRSFLGLLRGEPGRKRDEVYLERERHAFARAGNLSYPARAIRTRQFLYIRNFRPDRWPAGDPPHFNDIDNVHSAPATSPTKELLLRRGGEETISKFFHLATDKRPAEELYDLRRDPHQLVNIAGDRRYAGAKKQLRGKLARWMSATGDPRAKQDDDRFDRYHYFGPFRDMPPEAKP